MSISNSILLNGRYAIPHLMLLPHYYAEKFIECDNVIWLRAWYAECMVHNVRKKDALIAFECLQNLTTAKSVNIWRPLDLRKDDTYIQTCNKREKGVFEIHLYKVSHMFDHNLLYMRCKQWNKERGVYFSIGNGSDIKKIY